jgi:hypothetical protein
LPRTRFVVLVRTGVGEVEGVYDVAALPAIVGWRVAFG